MLIAVLDAELYLKSERTRARMVRVLATNVAATLDDRAAVHPVPGNRVRIDTDHPEAVDRLVSVFGIAAVEEVVSVPATDFPSLVESVIALTASAVAGHTFAVRPRRLGTHAWSSQDLAVAVGAGLVEAGGTVDLGSPAVTVAIRVSDGMAHVSTLSHPGVGGLPAGTQGRALTLFSGGVDSPVAAYLVARRGVALDHLHFSLGCGQADHAAGIAHLLSERHGAGTDPRWLVADLEGVVGDLTDRVKPRDRQIALKALMYRSAGRIASDLGAHALVTGESIAQVSTQTLENLAALDRLIDLPVLRPLVGLDKSEITTRAAAIGTGPLSARSRELCDISGGARVAVAVSPIRLAGIADELTDLVESVVATTKATLLADWVPGTGGI